MSGRPVVAADGAAAGVSGESPTYRRAGVVAARASGAAQAGAPAADPPRLCPCSASGVAWERRREAERLARMRTGLGW